MSVDLLGELRAADHAVELVELERRSPSIDAQNAYALSPPQYAGLAEPEAAAFMPGCYSPGCTNPAIFLAHADQNRLSPVDVLEALLYVANPEAACRSTAESAIDTFGSLGAVLSASLLDLTSKLRLEYQVACALKTIYAGMRSVLKEPLRERISIGSQTALIDYISMNKYATVEVLHVLYLDNKNGLICDEEPHRGTTNHVPLYPREIVKRALEFGASAVILVHNHPSGDPSPSQADIVMGREVQRALGTMGITLHDHLIVGANRTLSMRAQGHL